MGDPVRPHDARLRVARRYALLRRAPAAVLVVVASSAAVSLGGACGFRAVGSGPPDGSSVVRAAQDGAASIEDAAAFDGDATQAVSCTAPRSMCGALCTDTTADPENCGSCGNACSPGQTCNEGKCDVLCVGSTLRCQGGCIDPTSDPANCGACGTVCPGDKSLCVAGVCSKDCGMGQKVCEPDGGITYCATVATDSKNCGSCGNACTANQSCVGGKCKDLCTAPARVGDVFSPTMVGCVDRRQWSDRAKICPAGSTVCTAAKWNARPGATKPTFNYWTDDYLQWLGSGPGNCVAVTNGTGGACSGFPMHVCGATTDPVGNTCNWTHCGYVSLTPDQFYGGCAGDYYAGALCCTGP